MKNLFLWLFGWMALPVLRWWTRVEPPAVIEDGPYVVPEGVKIDPPLNQGGPGIIHEYTPGGYFNTTAGITRILRDVYGKRHQREKDFAGRPRNTNLRD